MAAGSTPVRAAIIGAGLMGRWHAHAIHRCGSRIVVIVDPDAARARLLATRLPGASAIATDVGQALRDHDVHVVHVCTPVASHEMLARAAIEAGAHVLVEKPVASDAPAVMGLHAMAADRGVMLCPVHQFLFQPGVQHAARHLATLGAVRQFDVVACSAGADGAADEVRESVALDILPHGLALARRLLGVAASSSEWQVHGDAPGELRAVSQLGATSIILSVSMRARPTEHSLTIRCDGGTVRANLFHGYATIERGTPTQLDKAGRPFIGSAQAFASAAVNLVRRATRGEAAYPGLRELVRRFHDAAAGRGSSPIGADESIDVARARDIIAAGRPRALR